MRRKLLATAVAAAALTAGVLTGCASSSGGVADSGGDKPLVIQGTQIASAAQYSAALKEGTLTLYTGQHPDAEQSLTKVFTQDTGIKVNLVATATNTVVERAISEYGAKKVDADVISVSAISNMEELKAANALAPNCTAYASDYEKSLSDPQCLFYPRTDNYVTMSVNTAVLQKDKLPVPTSWTDLLQPQWRGLVGVLQIGGGGSAWSFWKTMRDTYGLSYWEGMAKQKMLLAATATQTESALARGEIAVMISSPSTPEQLIGQGVPVKVLTPPIAPVFDSYVAVAADAPHPAAAKVFEDWLLSPRGQEVTSETADSDYPASSKAPGLLVNGTRQPPLTKLNTKLIYTEAQPTYISDFASWSKQWDQLFDYT